MRIQRIYQLKCIEENPNLFDSVTRTLADIRFLALILNLPSTHTFETRYGTCEEKTTDSVTLSHLISRRATHIIISLGLLLFFLLHGER